MGNLEFSDPAIVQPPPSWAVGQVSRSPDLDVLPGFQNPPAGFGVVPFYWWLGDPLTKERLSWQLNQLSDMGISGLQINYAHSDQGGISYGLTLPSDPKLFSEDWWKLVGWFMEEAKKRGIAISLSDYTLGPGQGWCFDEVVRDNPEIAGIRLNLVSGEAPVDALVTKTVKGSDGKPETVSVCAETVKMSVDPMNPLSGKEYAGKFFGKFEGRFPGECGRGLNFFFSDELTFGVKGKIWNSRFAEEFRKRKGYDIVPELPALFMDIGPRTPKIRMDYSDVMVALTEENFWKPLFDWHQSRGMTMGCDHGGRGRDVVEFGDYFRTQRWNQGPGCDQPNLGKNIIKTKVASSIAHLYLRPRVWLEGFYASGWGTTAAGLADATFANFVMGHNLLSLHGLYYSTHGGWWEWAPPCNGFRMPYWKDMKGFMDCVGRLSYLLSQGHHRCDVAILYPVAAVEAGMDGDKAVKTAFDVAENLYSGSVDFDFMDFESLARAKVVGKELQVSGESYRVLILPAMKAVRHSTLKKALEFKRAGGIVLAVGALPEASDRIGRGDREVSAMVKKIFPDGVTNDVFQKLPDRDYEGPGYVQHRKIGSRDLYAVYNAPQEKICRFRATGKVELWDPWTGAVKSLPVISQSGGFTEIALPLTKKEIQLIIFSPGEPILASKLKIGNPKFEIVIDGDWEFELQPTLDNRFGDFHWPPTRAHIGAEIRQIWYCEGNVANGPWSKVTCTFGPQFMSYEGMPSVSNLVKHGGKPVEFSWRYGIENDPGHQGYHGLKEYVHNEFIAVGRRKQTWNGSNQCSYEDDVSPLFLWTTVSVPKDMTAYALTGDLKPAKVWLNGAEVSGCILSLKKGTNTLVLNYDKPGRAYFVVSRSNDAGIEAAEPPLVPGEQLKFTSGPLAMQWWNNPDVLPFDVRPDENNPVGWYRFVSPPGLCGMTMKVRGKVQAWADDKPMTEKQSSFVVAQVSEKPVSVLIRIEQECGFYGGAALLEPIRLDCGTGKIALGDWAKVDGLLSYSGGAWYRKTVTIPDSGKVVLDLGEVSASAEVRVNGKTAGVLVSPPWRLDITQFAELGENSIEILVHNTLANHYTSIPTNYRGETTSGLFGPVKLILSSQSN